MLWTPSAERREFANAGLLDDLEGTARSQRISVLHQLVENGATIDELMRATQEGRLAHMLLEAALSPRSATYTLDEISELSGVSVDDTTRWFRAMGRGISKRSSAEYSADDVRLASLLTDYRELGLDEDSMFATVRILGRNVWAIADGAQSLLQDQLAEIGRDHPEDALRYAEELKRFAKFHTQILAHVMAVNLRQQIKADATDEHTPGAQEVAVSFADLVGFTALSEQLSAADLGQLAERLDTLTTAVVEHPVRFVKMVGDAVMLISPDSAALCRATLDIMAAARQEGLPALHAGIAWGTAVPSAGDWIGRPVNLANRIAAAAGPGEVLIDEDVQRKLGRYFPEAYESAGQVRLKGFHDRRQLFRLRA
ncbi:adenylate/guanylate cyclase domain-containing protein [Rhodococcus sp. NM-2]|uniref:adenylate/guanylate cyclase domain-containing protein n=1 Tax=Rhodococcus sp. NM-2 TaxID=3401174 RepID=UPI003AAFF519